MLWDFQAGSFLPVSPETHILGEASRHVNGPTPSLLPRRRQALYSPAPTEPPTSSGHGCPPWA